MLKLILTSLALLSATTAFAQNDISIRKIVTDNETSKAFYKMSKGYKFPDWVVEGGTSTPAMKVTLNSVPYQVVSACKPHDCAAEQIAILYSPENKSMFGVFSKHSADGAQQNLQWLNSENDIPIDGKTVLFAALSGSLENHPDAFNFK
ncbi:Ivy family C-type lysozyme inhibitor [Enterobacter ludwigii]|uniref:Ivy family C-type lysozyme inhibitor n=1 Tax=Enterobacter ludwigii TaxID=299767 RepID=UPI002FFC365B